MSKIGVSKSALSRLPAYLGYLKELPRDREFISATAIANALKFGDVQVRKDLAAVSGAGRPKIGYNVAQLIVDIESFLGFDSENCAIIIGAGKLGRALLNFDGFNEYGLNIAAAFDCNMSVVTSAAKKPIYPVSRLYEICSALRPTLGIITVPPSQAQEICDLMINANIKAIMNFSSAHLKAPPEIIIENENIASSLALLARHIK